MNGEVCRFQGAESAEGDGDIISGFAFSEEFRDRLAPGNRDVVGYTRHVECVSFLKFSVGAVNVTVRVSHQSTAEV